MGKTIKSQKHSTSSPDHQQTFGRPATIPLEATFMKKLRQGKLQAITAQSQAEISLNRIPDRHPEHYANRDQKFRDEEDHYGQQKIAWVRKMFEKSVNSQLLWKAYEQEIKQDEELPQYLFLDECDLSYILISIIKNQRKQFENKYQFNSSELLFLQLLSFATRDMIPFKVLKAFQDNFEEILNKLEDLPSKIYQQYIKSHPNQLVQKKEEKIEEKAQKQQRSQAQELVQANELPIQLRRGHFFNNLPSQEMIQDASSRLKKKFIQKQKLPKKKSAGRPKSKTQVQQELSMQNLQQMIQSLISHIAWCYLYIYPVCIQKKNRITS